MIALLLPLFLGEVTVTLPMEARVRGTEITLGEIANVAGDDAAEVERVAATSLGYSPMPGYTRLFHAARLAQIVQRETGLSARFAGDAACRVLPETKVIAADALTAAATAELERLGAGLDVEFRPRAPVLPVEVPAGGTGVELAAQIALKELVSGALSVPIQIRVDGKPWRTVWTAWEVALYEERTVLARDVRAGELLAPQSFAHERVLVPKSGAANPLGRRLVVGAVAARDLAAGALVTELDVERPIAVRRGDTLQLQARKGQVVARVTAVAVENGRIGDSILVSPVSGGREISAVVVTSDLCEVDLGS